MTSSGPGVGSALGRKGSAVRATLGLAATVSAFVLLAVPALWLGARAWPRGADMNELVYVVFALIVIVVGTLVVLPAAAYTVGRLFDRRGRGPAVFATIGAGLGFMPGVFLIGEPAQALVMCLLFAALGAAAGALGRYLFERGLRSREWRIAIWIAFAFTAPAPIFAAIILLATA